jgi:hypothetical protein
MSDMGFTPNLVAGAGTYGTISPFRFVYMDAVSWSGLSGAATAATACLTTPVGVSDGSVYAFGQTAHAVPTGPINLQPSNTVQIEAGAAITAGAFVMSDASGRATTLAATGATTTLNVSCYIALENATAVGDIIRAYRFGTRTIISP